MFKLKIVVIGPCKGGKTVLSNYLADATDSSGGDYHPTEGVRILEFESSNSDGKCGKVDIELWDCSGDMKFESCWPAMAKDAQGAIYVYNPEMTNQSQDLETFYDTFTEQGSLRPSQCLIFAHNKSADGSLRSISRPPSKMSEIQLVKTNLEDDGESLRNAFDEFVRQLLKVADENQKRDEDIIIGR